MKSLILINLKIPDVLLVMGNLQIPQRGQYIFRRVKVLVLDAPAVVEVLLFPDLGRWGAASDHIDASVAFADKAVDEAVVLFVPAG